MHPTSAWLTFAENQLQIIALVFMATVYAAKIRWILRFPAGGDRQAPRESGGASARKGAIHSLFAIAMPWEMPSTRRHRWLYAQFVIFHLGIAASILMSFLIPYVPQWTAPRGAVLALRTIFVVALIAGGARMIRRLKDPYVRSISTPDDYFSLALLLVWLAASFLAAPNKNEPALMGYFLLTAFFLVYVPFSKISHYLYYPFARWYLGRSLGHRGVYPVRTGGLA